MSDDLSGIETGHHQVPPADPRIETVGPRRKTSIWIKELPYSLILVLTLIGVAYTSLLNEPIVIYWEFLALAIGVMCIVTGWQTTNEQRNAIAFIFHAGTALVRISARDEYDAAA